MLVGPDTRWVIAAASKKQGCVSHSTPEAEIVAADFALRQIGLPAGYLWDLLTGHQTDATLAGTDHSNSCPILFQEDNQAMIRVCETGRNPTMRQLGRTHQVSVRWLHERFNEEWIDLGYCESDKQAADIFTKGFVDPLKWTQVCSLIFIVVDITYWQAEVRPVWRPRPDWNHDVRS